MNPEKPCSLDRPVSGKPAPSLGRLYHLQREAAQRPMLADIWNVVIGPVIIAYFAPGVLAAIAGDMLPGIWDSLLTLIGIWLFWTGAKGLLERLGAR